MTLGGALKVMGLSADTTLVEVKQPYKSLALKYHPDKNRGHQARAHEQFVELRHAYDVVNKELEASKRKKGKPGEPVRYPGRDTEPPTDDSAFSSGTSEYKRQDRAEKKKPEDVTHPMRRSDPFLAYHNARASALRVFDEVMRRALCAEGDSQRAAEWTSLEDTISKLRAANPSTCETLWCEGFEDVNLQDVPSGSLSEAVLYIVGAMYQRSLTKEALIVQKMNVRGGLEDTNLTPFEETRWALLQKWWVADAVADHIVQSPEKFEDHWPEEHRKRTLRRLAFVFEALEKEEAYGIICSLTKLSRFGPRPKCFHL